MNTPTFEIEDAPRQFTEQDAGAESTKAADTIGDRVPEQSSAPGYDSGQGLVRIDWTVALTDEQLGEEAALMAVGAARLLAERTAKPTRANAELANLREVPFVLEPEVHAALVRLDNGELLVGGVDGEPVVIDGGLCAAGWAWARPGFLDNSPYPGFVPSGGAVEPWVVARLLEAFDWLIHANTSGRTIFSISEGGRKYLLSGAAPALWCGRCSAYHAGGRAGHPA